MGKPPDFSNISPKALRETVNDLIRNGKMSLDESSPLVPLMFRDTPVANARAPEGGQQPMDVLALLREGLQDAQSRHETQTAYYTQLSIDALSRLQGQTSGVDVKA